MFYVLRRNLVYGLLEVIDIHNRYPVFIRGKTVTGIKVKLGMRLVAPSCRIHERNTNTSKYDIVWRWRNNKMLWSE